MEASPLSEVSPELESLVALTPGTDGWLRCGSDLVAIEEREGHRRLVARCAIPAGTPMFPVLGRETALPTRYSVQVSATLHLDQDCALDEQDLLARYFWRYLDHACEPTVRIVDRTVVAVRDIAVGDPVTFHYCTTEYDMASPFSCHCGSARCLGIVRGARHLSPVQRRRLEAWLPDYLR